MPFIVALLNTFKALIKATAYVLNAFIYAIIKVIVKVQFIPTRIANAVHIYKLKQQLNKEIKQQLIK